MYEEVQVAGYAALAGIFRPSKSVSPSNGYQPNEVMCCGWESQSGDLWAQWFRDSELRIDRGESIVRREER